MEIIEYTLPSTESNIIAYNAYPYLIPRNIGESFVTSAFTRAGVATSYIKLDIS